MKSGDTSYIGYRNEMQQQLTYKINVDKLQRFAHNMKIQIAFDRIKSFQGQQQTFNQIKKFALLIPESLTNTTVHILHIEDKMLKHRPIYTEYRMQKRLSL